MKRTLFLTVVAPLLVVLAGPVEAQVDEPVGWTAWFGCWEPEVAEFEDALAPRTDDGFICVLPLSGGGAELLTYENGSLVSRDGYARAGEFRVDRDGCSGVETFDWSEDGRRLYRSSELECTGGFDRNARAIFSIDHSGNWLSSEALVVRGATSVRAVRYRPVEPITALTPAERSALDDIALAIETARAAAAAPIDVPAVIEATASAGAPAVEAWLVYSGQEFSVDATQLRTLAASDVPASVIDLLVALSYPNLFAIDRGTRTGERVTLDDPRRPRPRGRAAPWYYPIYGRGFYPGYYGGYYGRPVVIVRNPDGPRRSNGGRAVRGRGYTRPSSGSGSPDAGPGRSVGGRSGGGGSGDVTPSGTGRTAKPRS